MFGAEGPCEACVRASGLCQRHAKGVLPQLKQPSWYRDAHSGLWTDEKERAATMSPEAQRIQRRKQTKAARRARMAAARTAQLTALRAAA